MAELVGGILDEDSFRMLKRIKDKEDDGVINNFETILSDNSDLTPNEFDRRINSLSDNGYISIIKTYNKVKLPSGDFQMFIFKKITDEGKSFAEEYE